MLYFISKFYRSYKVLLFITFFSLSMKAPFLLKEFDVCGRFLGYKIEDFGVRVGLLWKAIFYGLN